MKEDGRNVLETSFCFLKMNKVFVTIGEYLSAEQPAQRYVENCKTLNMNFLTTQQNASLGASRRDHSQRLRDSRHNQQPTTRSMHARLLRANVHWPAWPSGALHTSVPTTGADKGWRGREAAVHAANWTAQDRRDSYNTLTRALPTRAEKRITQTPACPVRRGGCRRGPHRAEFGFPYLSPGVAPLGFNECAHEEAAVAPGGHGQGRLPLLKSQKSKSQAMRPTGQELSLWSKGAWIQILILLLPCRANLGQSSASLGLNNYPSEQW